MQKILGDHPHRLQVNIAAQKPQIDLKCAQWQAKKSLFYLRQHWQLQRGRDQQSESILSEIPPSKTFKKALPNAEHQCAKTAEKRQQHLFPAHPCLTP